IETGRRPDRTRSVLSTVNRPVARSTGSPPVRDLRSFCSRSRTAQTHVCQANRGRPNPGSLTTCVPSALTVPVPHVCQAPATRSKNQRSAGVPGGASVTFGKLIGSGCEGTELPGWILNSIGGVIPGGNGIGLRSTGTGVIVICRTGKPSGPVIFVFTGIVTTRPGTRGVGAWTSCEGSPLPSALSGSVIGCAVSSRGRYRMNGTREGPDAATLICTSTSGYWAGGGVAVVPSTRSICGPGGSGWVGDPCSTKLPAASVTVKPLARVTWTPGIGLGTASAVRTRPVTTGVVGTMTPRVTDALRVCERPSTSAWPVTVKL